jgi:hypothetical protein
MIETANGTAPSRRHSNTALGLGLLRPRSATWGSRGSRVACREVAWLGSGQPTIHHARRPAGPLSTGKRTVARPIQGQSLRGDLDDASNSSVLGKKFAGRLWRANPAKQEKQTDVYAN